MSAPEAAGEKPNAALGLRRRKRRAATVSALPDDVTRLTTFPERRHSGRFTRYKRHRGQGGAAGVELLEFDFVSGVLSQTPSPRVPNASVNSCGVPRPNIGMAYLGVR